MFLGRLVRNLQHQAPNITSPCTIASSHCPRLDSNNKKPEVSPPTPRESIQYGWWFRNPKNNHLGCNKTLYRMINYQAQLVNLPDFGLPSTVWQYRIHHLLRRFPKKREVEEPKWIHQHWNPLFVDIVLNMYIYIYLPCWKNKVSRYSTFSTSCIFSKNLQRLGSKCFKKKLNLSIFQTIQTKKHVHGPFNANALKTVWMFGPLKIWKKITSSNFSTHKKKTCKQPNLGIQNPHLLDFGVQHLTSFYPKSWGQCLNVPLEARIKA